MPAPFTMRGTSSNGTSCVSRCQLPCPPILSPVVAALNQKPQSQTIQCSSTSITFCSAPIVLLSQQQQPSPKSRDFSPTYIRRLSPATQQTSLDDSLRSCAVSLSPYVTLSVPSLVEKPQSMSLDMGKVDAIKSLRWS